MTTGKVAERDVKLAHEIVDRFKGGSPASALYTTSPEEDRLRVDIANALAAVRQEEQEAERKRLLLIVQSLPPTAAGASAFKKSVIAALQSAAKQER